MNSTPINGKREVFDVILNDGNEEWAQAWSLASFDRAAAFSRSLELPESWTREIRQRWETVS